MLGTRITAGLAIATAAPVPSGDIPENGLTLDGEALTLDGETLTLDEP